MCTVSWLYADGEYQLFFNRDERLTRRPALAPEYRQAGAMNYLSPLDGDYGGTWIGVNESGVSLCLLNRYDAVADGLAREFRSRGELIPRLIAGSSLSQIEHLLKAMRLCDYPPFTLVVFSREGKPWHAHWHGDDLEIDQDLGRQGIITSSSFATAEVTIARETAYRQQLGNRDADDVDAELLLRFQASHDPISGARSVCLHRKDAMTVSLTHIYVAIEWAYCWYYSSSPCTISTSNLTEIVLPQIS